MPDMETGKKAYNAEDYDAAYTHYQDLAEFGIPEAKIRLGQLYLYGKGPVERDPEKALALFNEAAAEGEKEWAERYIPRTKGKLGSMVLKDRINGYSEAQALAMLKEGAEAGDRNALFELGYAYENGLGVPADGQKAAQYYKRSTDKGYSRATFYHGRLFLKGDLVPQDIPLALKLYESAGENGYPRAYTELAKLYKEGELVGHDRAKAAHYAQLASKKGETLPKSLASLQKKSGHISEKSTTSG